MAGRFIVIEGPEGAGKTTLAGRLVERLRGAGRAVVAVREPGGTDAAEAARELVLDPRYDVAPAAELFLLLAARADLVAKVIRPALASEAVVVSDRFDLSTLAYQVAGRGLDRRAVLAANHLATGGLVPDLTLVLDVDPAAAAARQAAQGKSPDRMERTERAFHDRVARAFREATGPGVVHLDARGPVSQVETLAWQHVEQVVGLAGDGNTVKGGG